MDIAAFLPAEFQQSSAVDIGETSNVGVECSAVIVGLRSVYLMSTKRAITYLRTQLINIINSLSAY